MGTLVTVARSGQVHSELTAGGCSTPPPPPPQLLRWDKEVMWNLTPQYTISVCSLPPSWVCAGEWRPEWHWLSPSWGWWQGPGVTLHHSCQQWWQWWWHVTWHVACTSVSSSGLAAGTITTILTIALLVFGWRLHMRWSLGPVHTRQCNVWHTPSRECDVQQCYNDIPPSNAPWPVHCPVIAVIRFLIGRRD